MSTNLVLRCYLVTPYNWVFLEGNNAKEIVSANSLEYRLKDICTYERVQYRLYLNIYRLTFFERGNNENLNVITKWNYFLYNKFIYLVLLKAFIFWKFLKIFSISDNIFLFYIYYAIKNKVWYCCLLLVCLSRPLVIFIFIINTYLSFIKKKKYLERWSIMLS